jgi:hypothetical protein
MRMALDLEFKQDIENCWRIDIESDLYANDSPNDDLESEFRLLEMLLERQILIQARLIIQPAAACKDLYSPSLSPFI